MPARDASAGHLVEEVDTVLPLEHQPVNICIPVNQHCLQLAEGQPRSSPTLSALTEGAPPWFSTLKLWPIERCSTRTSRSGHGGSSSASWRALVTSYVPSGESWAQEAAVCTDGTVGRSTPKGTAELHWEYVLAAGTGGRWWMGAPPTAPTCPRRSGCVRE